VPKIDKLEEKFQITKSPRVQRM